MGQEEIGSHRYGMLRRILQCQCKGASVPRGGSDAGSATRLHGQCGIQECGFSSRISEVHAHPPTAAHPLPAHARPPVSEPPRKSLRGELCGSSAGSRPHGSNLASQGAELDRERVVGAIGSIRRAGQPSCELSAGPDSAQPAPDLNLGLMRIRRCRRHWSVRPSLRLLRPMPRQRFG